MLNYIEELIKSTYTWNYKIESSFLLFVYIILLFIVTYLGYIYSNSIHSLWIIPILYILINEVLVSILDKLIWKSL